MADLLPGTPREHIARMWPKHLEHLAPEGNTMGQGLIDPDEGVVCNCGEVLGFPAVQDEADYVAAEPDQPDTSGAQTGEPDDDLDDSGSYSQPDVSLGEPVRHDTSGEYHEDEPDWTPQLTEREHAPDPDSYQDPDMLEDLEGQSAPGPLAQSVQDKADTIDAIWDHPDTQAAVAEAHRDAEMRERFEANPHDVEARAWVHSHPREELDTATREASPFPGHSGDGSPEFPEPGWLPPEPPTEPKGVMPYRDHGVVPAEDPLAARVVTIDPTQPYGPLDVEHQLLDIAQRLERGVHFQRYWEERQFAADATYTNKAARERWNHRGDGAKDVRDAAVHMACQEEWTELRLCDAMVRAIRETMHNLRSLQTGYQTVARSVTESTKNPAGSRGRP
jgi:hypothetical protein